MQPYEEMRNVAAVVIVFDAMKTPKSCRKIIQLNSSMNMYDLSCNKLYVTANRGVIWHQRATPVYDEIGRVCSFALQRMFNMIRVQNNRSVWVAHATTHEFCQSCDLWDRVRNPTVLQPHPSMDADTANPTLVLVIQINLTC